VLVPVIPILIAITWLTVVATTIGACRLAACADAAEVEIYREARRGSSVRCGEVRRRVPSTGRERTLRLREGAGVGADPQLYRAAGCLAQLGIPQHAGSALAGTLLHRARRDPRRPDRLRTLAGGSSSCNRSGPRGG
jgi:hypothetical protein